MKIIFLLCLACLANAYTDSSYSWQNYRRRFKKQYRTSYDEAVARYYLTTNMRECDKHNSDYKKGKCSFLVDANEFMDTNLTATVKKLCGTVLPNRTEFKPRLLDLGNLFPILNLPLSVDYSYLLPPVVSQKQCGSCWAIASTTQLEALYQQTSFFNDYTFSSQFLVDCSRNSPNSGCKGGWPKTAMGEIIGFKSMRSVFVQS